MITPQNTHRRSTCNDSSSKCWHHGPGPVKSINTAIMTWAQNKDTQKVDSSNRCHAMIHHQNADAMVLASARLRGIPPWTSAILNIIRGCMPLTSAQARTMASVFWWRITVTPKSLENKTKKSAFCVACLDLWLCEKLNNIDQKTLVIFQLPRKTHIFYTYKKPLYRSLSWLHPIIGQFTCSYRYSYNRVCRFEHFQRGEYLS
jgi:hypothetical protein